MRFGLLLIAIGCLAFLGACGSSTSSTTSGGSATPGDMRFKDERDKWDRQVQSSFSSANDSIEKTKMLLSKVRVKGNVELLQSLVAAQAAIQDVSQKQSSMNAAFGNTFTLLDTVVRENQKLDTEKTALQVEKADLENNEKWLSRGIIASVSVVFVTIVGLLIKLPTAFLDRRYRKLEIAVKELEMQKLKAEIAAFERFPAQLSEAA